MYPGNCHLLINNNKESFQIKIGNKTIAKAKYEMLLGLKIDHELNFSEHVTWSKKAETKCLSHKQDGL